MRTYKPRQTEPVLALFLFHALTRYMYFRAITVLRRDPETSVRSLAYARHLRALARRMATRGV